MRRLLIISSSDRATADEQLSELATFLGVSTAILPLARDGRAAHELLSQVGQGPYVLAMHMETLGEARRALGPQANFQQWLGDRVQEVLLYGADADFQVDGTLAAITDGAIRGLNRQPGQAGEYSFSNSARELCAQLAGQALQVKRDFVTSTFEVRSGSGVVETILSANARPTFVRFRASTRDLFFLAGHLPNIRTTLSPDTSWENACIPLLPLIIFLRYCFPESCWHGGDATARLIIDDPLLTRRYGGLNFERLKLSMEQFGYGTSIAFIPWNHWRTSTRCAVQLFSPGTNLSICIHGCDHTNHEFKVGSPSVLAKKAALGIRRMERHRRRVGAPFEDVMVFPQGQFSKAAILGLRSANYLAAVNSTCFPTDYLPTDLRLVDFLSPAITRFDGFPIFQRRYPRSTFQSAMDLFLGRPALLVEHHEYFRDDCRAMEAFVAALHRLDPTLSWPGLSQQLMRSNMKRRNGNGLTEIRFFTRRFQLTPTAAEEGRYRLIKFDPAPEMVEYVLVDGNRIPYGFENGNLTFEIQAVPGQLRKIEVVDRASPAAPMRSFGNVHNARVLVRRGLSELRDGALSRHKSILKIATRLVKAVKATGEA